MQLAEPIAIVPDAVSGWLVVKVCVPTVIVEVGPTVVEDPAASVTSSEVVEPPRLWLQSFSIGFSGTGRGLAGATGLAAMPPTASTVFVSRFRSAVAAFGSATTGSAPILRLASCNW